MSESCKDELFNAFILRKKLSFYDLLWLWVFKWFLMYESFMNSRLWIIEVFILVMFWDLLFFTYHAYYSFIFIQTNIAENKSVIFCPMQLFYLFFRYSDILLMFVFTSMWHQYGRACIKWEQTYLSSILWRGR